MSPCLPCLRGSLLTMLIYSAGWWSRRTAQKHFPAATIVVATTQGVPHGVPTFLQLSPVSAFKQAVVSRIPLE